MAVESGRAGGRTRSDNGDGGGGKRGRRASDDTQPATMRLTRHTSYSEKRRQREWRYVFRSPAALRSCSIAFAMILIHLFKQQFCLKAQITFIMRRPKVQRARARARANQTVRMCRRCFLIAAFLNALHFCTFFFCMLLVKHKRRPQKNKYAIFEMWSPQFGRDFMLAK